jgi:hypothetical protein
VWAKAEVAASAKPIQQTAREIFLTSRPTFQSRRRRSAIVANRNWHKKLEYRAAHQRDTRTRRLPACIKVRDPSRKPNAPAGPLDNEALSIFCSELQAISAATKTNSRNHHDLGFGELTQHLEAPL